MRSRFCPTVLAAWALGAACFQVAAVAQEESAVPAELSKMAPLLERFSGHLALLPGTHDAASQAFPLTQWLREAGLLEHFRLLSGAELVDPQQFNAKRFPVVLYASGEPYRQTVNESEDGDRALLRYLEQGGTLLVLSSGPLPFWYNEKGQPAQSPSKFGLPIAGAGVRPWPDHLTGVRASSDGPPEGRTFTFHVQPGQNLLAPLPSSFLYPSPSEGDQRWRGIVNAPPEGSRYLPLVSLQDDQGAKYGEGVALIEHDTGRFKGARLAYAWCSLLLAARTREPILTGLLHYALSGATPPPASIDVPLTLRPPLLDGRLEDPCWATAVRTQRFLPGGGGMPPADLPELKARFCWTPTDLYVGFESGQPAAAGETATLAWIREGTIQTVVLRPGQASETPSDQVKAIAVSLEAGWTAEVSVPFGMVGLAQPRPSESFSAQVLLQRQAPRGLQLFWSPAHDLTADSLGTLLLAPDPHGDSFDLYPEGSDGKPWWRIGGGKWHVDDGAFVGENTGTDGFLAEGAAYGDDSWGDYELTVRFKVDSYADNWRDGPRIGFRCNSAGDGYHVNFNDRNVQVHKSILGTSTNDTSALATAPWQRDHEWHTLKVRAVRNTFQGELDGQALFEFRDDMVLEVPSHRRGGVILSARRWTQAKGEMRVRYDDVRITPLPPVKRWSFE